MKLPENETTRLSHSVRSGVDDSRKTLWRRETREVTNTELKALMESYKEKSRGSVFSELSDRKADASAHISVKISGMHEPER